MERTSQQIRVHFFWNICKFAVHIRWRTVFRSFRDRLGHSLLFSSSSLAGGSSLTQPCIPDGAFLVVFTLWASYRLWHFSCALLLCCPFVRVPVCLPVRLSGYLFCLSVCLSVCLSSVYVSVCLSVCLLSVYVSVCMSVCWSVCLLSVCVCMSVCLPVCCLSMCLSVCLPVCCLSVCLSVSVCCVSMCLSVCLSVCLFVVNIYTQYE